MFVAASNTIAHARVTIRSGGARRWTARSAVDVSRLGNAPVIAWFAMFMIGWFGFGIAIADLIINDFPDSSLPKYLAPKWRNILILDVQN
jgi:hypothetical protein